MSDRRMLRGLLVRVGEPPALVTYEDSLEGLYRALGCELVEFAHHGLLSTCETACMVIDEEGKINGAEPNRAIYRSELEPDGEWDLPAALSDDALVDVVFGDALIIDTDPATGANRDLPEGAAREAARAFRDWTTGPLEVAGIMARQGASEPDPPLALVTRCGSHLSIAPDHAPESELRLANLGAEDDLRAVERVVPAARGALGLSEPLPEREIHVPLTIGQARFLMTLDAARGEPSRPRSREASRRAR